jgi:hypothetical protein
MSRNLKAIFLISFAIVLGISTAAQTKEDKEWKHLIRKERNKLPYRTEENNEIPEIKAIEEIKEPCSDFQDNEDFLYSTGKGQGHNYNMAMQNAIRIAQSELNKKIMSDERYKDIRQQGISLNISEVCKQMGMDKDGLCFCYVAIRVARKDLESSKYHEEGQSRQHETAMKHIQQILNNETDSINVLQEK